METMRTIPLARTRTGRPALWEQGGGTTNTGQAQVIAGPNGEPLLPVYVARRGSLAGGQHALLPVQVGSLVVEADHHRDDMHVNIGRITRLDEATCEVATEATFERGEWDVPAEEAEAAPWWDAMLAAWDKSRCYHCRETHFTLAADAAGTR